MHCFVLSAMPKEKKHLKFNVIFDLVKGRGKNENFRSFLFFQISKFFNFSIFQIFF